MELTAAQMTGLLPGAKTPLVEQLRYFAGRRSEILWTSGRLERVSSSRSEHNSEEMISRREETSRKIADALEADYGAEARVIFASIVGEQPVTEESIGRTFDDLAKWADMSSGRSPSPSSAAVSPRPSVSSKGPELVYVAPVAFGEDASSEGSETSSRSDECRKRPAQREPSAPRDAVTPSAITKAVRQTGASRAEPATAREKLAASFPSALAGSRRNTLALPFRREGDSAKNPSATPPGSRSPSRARGHVLSVSLLAPPKGSPNDGADDWPPAPATARPETRQQREKRLQDFLKLSDEDDRLLIGAIESQSPTGGLAALQFGSSQARRRKSAFAATSKRPDSSGPLTRLQRVAHSVARTLSKDKSDQPSGPLAPSGAKVVSFAAPHDELFAQLADREDGAWFVRTYASPEMTDHEKDELLDRFAKFSYAKSYLLSTHPCLAQIPKVAVSLADALVPETKFATFLWVALSSPLLGIFERAQAEAPDGVKLPIPEHMDPSAFRKSLGKLEELLKDVEWSET